MEQVKTSKLKNGLEIASNVTIIVVGVLVVGIIGWNIYLYNQNTPPSNPALQAGIIKGQILPGLSDLDYAKSDRTLLIAMSTKCIHCKESVPFIKKLTEESPKFKVKTQILSLFPNSENEVKTFSEEHQLQISTKAAVQLTSMNVTGTPTMVLIDSSGKVLDFWVGAIPEKDQQEVLKELES